MSADAAQPAPFAALMARMLRDGDAGLGYETLRRRLIRFFRLHLPAQADELADAALDRLARKLREGVEIVSVPLYTLGIARMVLHEAHARNARRRLAEADPVLRPERPSVDTDESATVDAAMLAALEKCLDAAGAAPRALILAYYDADGRARIAARQRLAAEQRITVNALRNRALRLRDALERCVRKRLGDGEQP